MYRFFVGQNVFHAKRSWTGWVRRVYRTWFEVYWRETGNTVEYSWETKLVHDGFEVNKHPIEKHFRVGQKVRNRLGIEGIITSIPPGQNGIEVRYHFPDTASTAILRSHEAQQELTVVAEPVFYHVGDYVRHREAPHLGVGVVDISGRCNVRVQFPNDPASPRHYARAFVHLVKVDTQQENTMYAGCYLKTDRTPYGEYNYFDLFDHNTVRRYSEVGKGYVVLAIHDSGRYPTRGYPTYEDAEKVMKHLTDANQQPFAIVNIKAICLPPGEKKIHKF